jgi:preprotein translocase subunit SecE
VSDGNAVHASEGKSASKATEKRTGPVTFYRQVVAELRKVVWPTRDQLVTYFFVVMAFVLFMIALVSVLDLGLGKLAFEVFGGSKSTNP